MQTLQELENDLASTQNPRYKDLISAKIQKLKMLEKSATGDNVATMLLALKDVLDSTVSKPVNSGGGGASISKQEVENLLKDAIRTNKIKLQDLDDSLRTALTSAMKVNLVLTTNNFQSQISSNKSAVVDKALVETKLFQKLLSDIKAMNNIYLFGGAGTGKTFLAGKMAKYLDYEYIELTCNQFTSPIDILGGQTIDGYQRGKLERAWGNLDEYGQPISKKGVVLCLDELPKLDPNTAGILNGALAKVKEYDDNGLTPPIIENGKGDKIVKKNLVVIATGNVKLNETSTEYEANFKQDLSLQDRFVGSCYEVSVNYEYEANEIMKGYLFIWLASVKLREKIIEKKWTGFAFVSLRIMINLLATYQVYRAVKDNPIANSSIVEPKTLIDGFNSFLNLFKADQIQVLKEAMDYDNFKLLVQTKNAMPIDNLDTDSEKAEAQKYIDANKKQIEDKIA
jgi:cobaltochelatase CobS